MLVHLNVPVALVMMQFKSQITRSWGWGGGEGGEWGGDMTLLQSIPRESNDKDMAAMLNELTNLLLSSSNMAAMT